MESLLSRYNYFVSPQLLNRFQFTDHSPGFGKEKPWTFHSHLSFQNRVIKRHHDSDSVEILSETEELGVMVTRSGL